MSTGKFGYDSGGFRQIQYPNSSLACKGGEWYFTESNHDHGEMMADMNTGKGGLAQQRRFRPSRLSTNPSMRIAMHKTKKTLHLAALAMATLALTTFPTQAEVLFSDDFETPDVEPGYDVKETSQKADDAKWVRSAEGYNSQLSGIVDEGENNGSNFTDPVGSQAYGTRYTNSGATTAKGVIGKLTKGVTYTVSFDLVVDGFNSGGNYLVGLVTFAPDAIRSDTSTTGSKGISNGASAILATLSGAASGKDYEKKIFTYTADGSEKTLGHDLAVRIVGSTNSANIDNISVTTNGGGRDVVDAGNGARSDYSDWISNYPGVGGQSAFNDDADGDGIVNGLENFFGTAPDKVNDGLVAVETRAETGKQFTFTHPENPSPANNISPPVYQWTSDQKTFHPSGEKVGHTTIIFKRARNSPSAGTTTVTGTITGSVPYNIFVNVAVSLNP